MGVLLPNCGNITYSGAGVLSPLSNDPNYLTIGNGTRIFIGGAQGYITGSGTQHSSAGGFGTLSVQGDLKEMSSDYIRAANFDGYGSSIYIGMGVPIPILNEEIAASTAVTDADVSVSILDYGVPSRDRPSLRQVTYEELRSGSVEIDGKDVKTSSLSSFKKSRIIANELKDWISRGEFFVSSPVENLQTGVSARPMKQTEGVNFVSEIMSANVVTIYQDASVFKAAKTIMESSFDHLPVVNTENSLVGIVTSWDISKAVAEDKFDLVEDVMTRKVTTARADEKVSVVARRIEQNGVSAMPVLNNNKNVIGIVTSDDISKLIARRT